MDKLPADALEALAVVSASVAAAVVAVVLFIAVSFLLSLAGIDMFSLLGGNPAMQ